MKLSPRMAMAWLWLALPFLFYTPASATEPIHKGVWIYGATPAGVMAALAAADEGLTVHLVEPTTRLGGMLTNGLSHTDIRTFESITGYYLDFTRRVEAYYLRTYGEKSTQYKSCFRGIFAEPKVNLLVLEAMLKERPRVQIYKQHVLATVVQTRSLPSRINSVTVQGPAGQTLIFHPDILIDASYEGDLLAKAGVAFEVGREGREKAGESLAPDQTDDQLQAYNFRWIMTNQTDNRVLLQAPPNYKREDFLPVLEAFQSGKIDRVFGYPNRCVFKAQLPALPNNKYDINDVSGGLVRLSLPGKNGGWPNGNERERAAIFAEHRRDQEGLLYFLQNDAAVPEKLRNEAREWGWCKDEFTENEHRPVQLYIREARRMQGVYIFKEADCEHAANDARSPLQIQSIAIGDYGNNCHGTFHEGPRFGGKHTGEFYKAVPAYQIPYGVIVPKTVSNLFVVGAVSSTHVGFCALRYEPIWGALGQAAGHASALAISRPVQEVPVAELQKKLHKGGLATIYFSDVMPGHPLFTQAQWWGTLGGFHGLVPKPKKTGERGKNITGQYFEAFPNHAADLEKPLTKETQNQWENLWKSHFPMHNLPKVDGAVISRGEWLRMAYASVNP